MPGGQAHNRIEGTPNNTFVTVGTSSTLVLSERADRLHTVLTNDSNETIYLSLGQTAVSGSGLPLNPGGSYTIDYTALFIGQVNAICATGGKNLSIMDA